MRSLDLAAHEKGGLLYQEMSDLHCRRAFDLIVATSSCSLGVLPMVTPKD
jgi:hypothetical protein